METIIEFLAFIVWSFGIFLVGVYVGARKATDKLCEAIGDKEVLKKALQEGAKCPLF